MKAWFAILGWLLLCIPLFSAANYSIEAIRYGTIPKFPLSGLLVGAPASEQIDIPLVFWLVRGGGRIILVDTGCHRQKWLDQYKVTDFISPDEAVRLAGVEPSEVTDIIITHAHWDHMDGIDLFPEAVIWIQKEEYAYYTGPAWQSGGQSGAIEPEDLVALLKRNMQRKLRLIDGDDREILPGIRVFLGARHTFASQYVLVDGSPRFVLASDNCYLYRNLESKIPIPTFTAADRPGNLEALARMASLAGSPERVIPGHDSLVFQRFPTEGRIAKIK